MTATKQVSKKAKIQFHVRGGEVATDLKYRAIHAEGLEANIMIMFIMIFRFISMIFKLLRIVIVWASPYVWRYGCKARKIMWKWASEITLWVYVRTHQT